MAWAPGEELRVMGHDAVEEERPRRRRSRHKHRRKNRRLEKVLYDLRWMAGGIAIGLPLLAALIYFASRY
jgi:hypothetical protein